MLVHGFAAMLAAADRTEYSGPCPTLAGIRAWANGRQFFYWPLLPSPPEQQEACLRLGLPPTYRWEKWPSFEWEETRDEEVVTK
jgi:hypothetical protein